MQAKTWQKKILLLYEAFQSKYMPSRGFILLSIFLLGVILVSFIIPILHFGRFFGTDDYTHLFHTKEMASSTGISDFYEKIGTQVSNPSSGENLFNYPFGLWLFGATLVKITGMSLISAELLFVIFFLLIILGSFYLYSSVFLTSNEQKILGVLFLLSMPNTALGLLSYAPTIFIFPFLFIILYIALKEPVQWKLFPIVWLSIFIIIVSHTGTFIFLILFSILFFLLYCLFWGKFSFSMYLVILSSFIIYVFSLKWFPEIANQYIVKSTLFLSPGNFLATKFNFTMPLELSDLFYQNMMINQDFIYTLFFGALIYVIGKLFWFIHIKISDSYSKTKPFFPLTLPISNISHSAIATPLWIGPLHVMLSIFGFFRIDNKGKCVLISALLITLTPDLLLNAQGISAATGALREISYLAIIIPITAVLGFSSVVSYLDSIKHTKKNIISFIVWTLVLSAIIITPILATTYYLPKIAGEDYIIEGMTWLGATGDSHEKVVGYGYRTIPIYTNMTDASYGLQNGYDITTFVKFLRGTYFSSTGTNVDDLRHYYGVKYILTSEKLAANIGGAVNDLAIDNNKAVDKIYSSKDFGIYDIRTSPENKVEKQFMAENVSLLQIGSSYQIETDVYKVVLNGNYPVIERFGTPRDNYLGEGFFNDFIQISGFREQTYIDPFIPPSENTVRRNSTVDQFILDGVSASHEIIGNQIIYRSVLKDQQNSENEASLLVRYTFYATTIKREFVVSHDWITSPFTQNMNVRFATTMFTPLNDFVIKSNQSRIQRHMYPTLDSVVKSEIIEDIFVHDRDRGIYIKNVPTAAYPTELNYYGSTLYNMSALSFAQSDTLKPGASLHVTQFLAPGDEATAEKNILDQEGISLLQYPDGIVPIILSGYRTPFSDRGYEDAINQGYQFLQEENIPYSEAVVPLQFTEIPGIVQNNKTTSKNTTANSSAQLKTIILEPNTIDLQPFANSTIKIIGSGSTGSKFYDDFSTQEQSIGSMVDYANEQNVPLIGFMPDSLNYNLDTLKIISDKKIPFIFSKYVNPPYYGIFGLQNKNPQEAIYHSIPSGVVLLPISLPESTSLTSNGENTWVLSAWKASINEAAAHDGMILLMIRSSDIGNPKYSEVFKSFISYAKNQDLTFTTPDSIVNHFEKIQNIQYSGSINGDISTINLTNNNDDMVRGVTFRIELPLLKNGNYSANNGNIVKTKKDAKKVIVYVSTDIAAHTTKNIKIEPDAPREKIVVILPRQPVEGTTTLSIKDAKGNPLTDAEAIIDSKYYRPDKTGNVDIDLKRGMHNVQIRCPGYEIYSQQLYVKGRIILIEQFFRGST